eukprot:4968850-Karenia_brevis.AAC.1
MFPRHGYSKYLLQMVSLDGLCLSSCCLDRKGTCVSLLASTSARHDRSSVVLIRDATLRPLCSWLA